MTQSHNFDATILREYDVRGIVGQTLSSADAGALGAAFGSAVVAAGGKTVAVGYDGRHSSPELEAALVDGLKGCGLTVRRVGVGPTPMLSFATYHLPTDAGVMVTGSHNPSDYNGFKMSLLGKPFFGKRILELADVAARGDYVTGDGEITNHDIQDDYVARLASEYKPAKPLTIAWDPGNGSGGEILRRLCEILPGKHLIINGEIDGDFPNHHPDPTVADNLVQLQDHVAANNCDLGIALDGDADRVGVIDGKGRILWADQLMMLLAEDVLMDNPGATIISDVKSSQVLFDEIARLGGRPLMWNTGHSVIKAKMVEEKSPLAGEMSGHIFFSDRYYGFDDALYAGVRLLSFLDKRGVPLSDLYDKIPPAVNTPELRFPCSETRKFEVVKELQARLAAAGADVIDIDGVRVKTDDGWWLLRASNTQDVLVARCEAADEAGLDRLKAQILEQLKASGIDAPADLI